MTELYVFLDDDICRLSFQFERGRVFLHLRAKASGLRVARRIIGLRDQVAAVLRAVAPRRVEVYFRTNRGLQRLCRRLGFVTYWQRNGWVRMEADNG